MEDPLGTLYLIVGGSADGKCLIEICYSNSFNTILIQPKKR